MALRTAIENHKKGWLERAKDKTAEVKAKGHVDEEDGIWGEIKGVYARLQYFKCIYCEKPMPQEEIERADTVGQGAVEYDVEHFRPKNRVKKWPNDKVKAARKIDYDDKIGAGESEGYTRLAFDPDNYGLSCKTCNSGHKSDSFPIAGKTRKSLVQRQKLDAQEQPLLMLPLGDKVDDPEAVLGWIGPVPVARQTTGYDNLRARVCIDFFSLDTRTDLLLQRALLVTLLWNVLEAFAAAPADQKKAHEEKLAGFTAPRMYFAACARAFAALYAFNRALAERVKASCESYLLSRDRAVFSTP